MVILGIAIVLIGIGSAADTQTGIPKKIVETDLVSWLNSDPPDITTGAAFVILGFVGALAAIFGLIGDVVPGTNGKALLDARMKRLESEEQRLDQMIKDPDVKPEQLSAVSNAVNKIRDDISNDKRRQFTLAAFIYLVLGAFFAGMLATNMLQALVIGFGWTAVVGVLGLNSDNQFRKSQKDGAIDDLENKITALKKEWEVYTKQIDELSVKVSSHNPEPGSIRTQEDIEHNKTVAAMLDRVIAVKESMNEVSFADKEIMDKIALARSM